MEEGVVGLIRQIMQDNLVTLRRQRISELLFLQLLGYLGQHRSVDLYEFLSTVETNHRISMLVHDYQEAPEFREMYEAIRQVAQGVHGVRPDPIA